MEAPVDVSDVRTEPVIGIGLATVGAMGSE